MKNAISKKTLTISTLQPPSWFPKTDHNPTPRSHLVSGCTFRKVKGHSDRALCPSRLESQRLFAELFHFVRQHATPIFYCPTTPPLEPVSWTPPLVSRRASSSSGRWRPLGYSDDRSGRFWRRWSCLHHAEPKAEPYRTNLRSACFEKLQRTEARVQD